MAHGPITPDAIRLGQALDRSAPMLRLQAMLRLSNERFEAVRPALPPALVAHVRPVPTDEAGLALLADNPAVAAKLRQWVPLLEQLLVERGEALATVKVKVRTR